MQTRYTMDFLFRTKFMDVKPPSSPATADICFAVNQVRQFLHQPTTHHWTAMKRILHYLKATPTRGLFYQPDSLILEAYSRADYTGCLDDPHSMGGYCIYLGHNPISWSAKKQRIV
ncbi:hypothetical protein SADUNF_Sadunf07G0034700 [Salix dunnii]|uniref:Reverse transcriptase Ty1/copia-type domain-containing protein n=1 Tax=Salix dunnii TaxID=1413687 RepID=A0A835K2X6_9ROSI|nr:hypothetical protein SADUNF_Sadunf07G0034700 [Salix dunnii]